MSTDQSQPYRGRFAPTPSGPVHLGTLLAALASYLDARSQQGIWHVRVDDIDPPREVAGAADSILQTLERYQLHWDDAVIYQSQRHEAYQTALEQLISQGDIYYCHCSRKSIEKVAEFGPNGAIYPANCRDLALKSAANHAIRLRTDNTQVSLSDLIQGQYQLNIQKDVGDYILKRSDGLYAYHIATVVDDALDNYTHIVRGQDLLSITPQQIYLQQKLSYTTPKYAHLPLITNADGVKFSKRSDAVSVNDLPISDVFKTLLTTLGLPVSNEINFNRPQEVLDWALTNWKLEEIPTSNYAA